MSTPEDTFREEADELLTDLEAALLELEDQPDDTELVGRVFRAMHTIKGSGAMFGFDALAAFTHHLETAFDRVRNGELRVTPDLIGIGLDARDHIRGLLDTQGMVPEQKVVGDALLERLRELKAESEQAPRESESQSAPPPPERLEVESDRTYRIRVRPNASPWTSGMDPLPLLAELRDLGPCHITTLTDTLPPIADMDVEDCYLHWDVILTTDRGENTVRDVFIFVEDDWEIGLEVIDEGDPWEEAAAAKPLGEILVDRGDVEPEQVEQALGQQRRTGEILASGGVSKEKIDAALAEQTQVRGAREERAAKENAASVRVPTEKLDTLMDLVGELVIAQARLNQSAADRDDADLFAIAEDLERLTTELRDNTLNIRMLPIGGTFSRFRRLVRDLSRDLGKEINLITEGAETELDKTVIDRLGDPLVHLIRNSIDHGIEAPDLREAAGKPRQGTVRLAAIHSESHVLIRIEDDGAGLDRDAIRAKAVDRGLLAPDAHPSDEEVYNLIFEPGFSTAKTVSGVSGRGVGMDVVKRSIDALRGKVRIESRRGGGTKVTVELPLTLAIIEGLLVRVAGDPFVVPLALVEECIELTGDEVEQAHGRQLVEVRGELVPYVRLRDWFGNHDERPPIEQIVIVNLEGAHYGCVADDVIGQHQTVIKGLGKLYEGLSGLAGATILGDGAVALILDVPKLIQSVMATVDTVH